MCVFPLNVIHFIYSLLFLFSSLSVVKRSTHVAKRENTFVEFAGRNIAEIEIPNIASARGRF